jgi:hypothetical protein
VETIKQEKRKTHPFNKRFINRKTSTRRHEDGATGKKYVLIANAHHSAFTDGEAAAVPEGGVLVSPSALTPCHLLVVGLGNPIALPGLAIGV